jgi:hypothetical protein
MMSLSQGRESRADWILSGPRELPELGSLGPQLGDPSHAKRTLVVRDHHVDKLPITTLLCNFGGRHTGNLNALATNLGSKPDPYRALGYVVVGRVPETGFGQLTIAQISRRRIRLDRAGVRPRSGQRTYERSVCGEHSVGDRRCPECHVFKPALGPGGQCIRSAALVLHELCHDDSTDVNWY